MMWDWNEIIRTQTFHFAPNPILAPLFLLYQQKTEVDRFFLCVLQRLTAHLHSVKSPPYVINLDPAVHEVPFPANIGEGRPTYLFAVSVALVP